MNIRLSKSQWERISSITENFGLISIGSVVIPALQTHFDVILFVLGIVAAGIFWYTSLVTAKKY